MRGATSRRGNPETSWGGKTGGGWTSPQEEKRDLIHWEKLRKGKRQETEKLDQPDSYEDGGRENSLVEQAAYLDIIMDSNQPTFYRGG